ncbi:YsnF/AvaK domain-containing protein [Adhaeribacter swui]|uniref:YsnF/AvaK domain-containing protein n=2 Tax=Adhaeribacter swui TaxID=2086471 RepID=A0A7G7GFC6_9BACT|nr:YsnF/AvaK domain-containing protein [Adhaeribacter swui]
MVVDLEDTSLIDTDDNNVLIPIGLAQLHESDDDVLLPNLEAAQLNSLPKYHKNMLNRDYEDSVRNAFAGLGTGAAFAGTASTDYYNHDFYNEDNLYRNRQTGVANTTNEAGTIPIIEEELHIGKQVVETGGARLRSRIIEKPVEESINLREEHVHVERTPVNRPTTDADLATFQEGEIEITEHAEVPVINKEARVVEEISLEKEVEVRDETIRDTIRRTDVEVENLDSDVNLENRRTTDLKNSGTSNI